MSDAAGWLVAGSSSPDEVRQYYDALAADYDATLDRWGYAAPGRAAQLVMARLGSAGAGANVLDAGCGTGLAGAALRAAGYTGRLTGLDLSPISLQRAAERQVYDSLDIADLQRPLPIADNVFDGAICVGVLTYVPDVSGIWRQFCRVVRPGGVIVCTQRDDLWHSRTCAGALDELERDHRWTVFHLSTPQPYLPGNDDFGDRIGARFVAATVR
jgi:predicted TPR repeat methyltransferase